MAGSQVPEIILGPRWEARPRASAEAKQSRVEGAR
jgi:hypothetical protein